MIKKVLKSNIYLLKLNVFFKALIYNYKTVRLSRKYYKKISVQHIPYSYNTSIDFFKRSISNRIKLNNSINNQHLLNVFWIGTNFDQDNSGFLQGLQKVFNVRVFNQSTGKYGFVSNLNTIDKVVEYNDREIYEAVIKEHNLNNIDIIIGQMWGNYISSNVLSKFKKLGIVVINVSMDDRLPEMWDKNNGSIGLKGGIDFVLTTAKEVCPWYWAEGIPSIYWPLASSAEFYSPKKYKDIPISFIGNNYGVRKEIINGIIKSGINIQCFGNGWENGYVNSVKAAEILGRSKIALGIGTIGHTKNILTMKLRDFDAPMSGALYITQRNPELENFYIENEEIVYYSSIKELVEKIKYYLLNEEETKFISERAILRATKEHTWENRFEKLRDIIIK